MSDSPRLAALRELNRNCVRSAEEADARWFDEHLAEDFHPAVVYGACAIDGFSVGNNITLAPLIVQREYGAAEFAAIGALSTAAALVMWRPRRA
ncbi:MAG: hypothetical protein ACRET7_00700 [Burkholderiales bacterium]